MIGGIGTGKSTVAESLSQDLEIDILSADQVEIDSNTMDDDDIEFEIMEQYLDKLETGESFILDGLNINRATRRFYITTAQRHGYSITCYDLGPGNEESLNRRLADPRGVPAARWRQIAESNIREYEAPTLEEGIEQIY